MADYGSGVIKAEALLGALLRPVEIGHQLPAEDDNNPLHDLFSSQKITSINLKSEEGTAVFHHLPTLSVRIRMPFCGSRTIARRKLLLCAKKEP